MMRWANYLVKLCKDILKIYTLYEKWNNVSGDKLVASLFDVLFIVEIFRLPHCIQQCAIHEFYILLMASATVKKHTFCTANETI